ncbi:hypothetical protein [Dyella sp. ASV21]|uniref:hypothetical protein n=1 Tax=Dyella sp. ASV21 TaxID=2795114 RepID=UPI0018ECEA5F|nr:hypothetical protein [Dyella sp. ASV21]
MAEPNFAENQALWDSDNPPLRMCYRKGAEHKAYGWAANKLTRLSQAHQDAYARGYAGEPMTFHAWKEQQLIEDKQQLRPRHWYWAAYGRYCQSARNSQG